jgi:hypothetical protein
MSIVLQSSGGGSITVQEPATASNFTQTLPAGTGTTVVNGVNSAIVHGTAVTPTGSNVDFTGIPSWAKRITVMFNNVSTNGASVPMIQLGTSTGVENTGYISGTGVIQASTPSQVTTVTSGILLLVTGFLTSASSFTGAVTFSLLNNNAWIASGTTTREAAGTTVFFIAGSKTLTGVLDRVRITTVNGTDAFDAGSINILYD